jgi:hypothetical protein
MSVMSQAQSLGTNIRPDRSIATRPPLEGVTSIAPNVLDQSRAASSSRPRSELQIQNLMLQTGVNQSHMEIMHKQQILKEPCELPFVFLSEQDEKLIFDLSVSLKFGNAQTVFKSCSVL